MRLRAFVLLGLVVAPARAEITLDGRLDEPEWFEARVFTEGFATTEPNTLVVPALRTEARVLTLPDALYVGFRCDQPESVPRATRAWSPTA